MLRDEYLGKGKNEAMPVWRVVFWIGLAYLLFFLKILSNHQWDPLTFVLLTPGDLPAGQTWGVGYDGRFSYHIAVNPLGSTQGLDEPNYRYQRILYPLLVKLLSLGIPELVPWLMIAVNWAATLATGYSLGRLLALRKVPPGYVFVLVFSLGYLLAMRMDLLEPMALALALAGWFLYRRCRTGAAILFFILSGLTKEIGLVFPFALAVWELLRLRPLRSLVVLGTSLAPYLLLMVYLSNRFGYPDLAVEKSALYLIPYGGLAYLRDAPSQVLVLIWCVGPSIVFGLWALWEIIRKGLGSIEDPDVLLVLSQALLIAVLPIPTWKDPLAIFRFNLGLILSVTLWFARCHRKALPYMVGLWLPSGLILWLIPGML